MSQSSRTPKITPKAVSLVVPPLSEPTRRHLAAKRARLVETIAEHHALIRAMRQEIDVLGDRSWIEEQMVTDLDLLLGDEDRPEPLPPVRTRLRYELETVPRPAPSTLRPVAD